MSADLFSEVKQAVSAAAAGRLRSWGAGELAEKIELERPAQRQHGDLSLNLALAAAGRAGRPPRELAAELVADLEADERLSTYCRRLEIAGPGFINLFLDDAALGAAALAALAAGDDFGRGEPPAPLSILLEFVSANPTGPLHVGHARYAAYGDSLARILTFAGHRVDTEFYINDYGTQMDLFARSLAVAYARRLGKELPLPEDGYRGDYLDRIAATIVGEKGEALLDDLTGGDGQQALSFLRRRGCELMLAEIEATLGRFRVHFDRWFSESSLYRDQALETLLAALRRSGDVTDRDGATWMLTSRHGDDKDRVLIRSSGEPTYFASDIAYHRQKLDRGYDRLINIWGADHHGYVARMKAAFAALDEDPDKLEIIIGQLVNVIERGERKQMSKRAGTMVMLDELIDAIGVDAARFFLVERSHDSALDLDLEKARMRSEENPVYYVHYAHARICSILRKAAGSETEAVEAAPPGSLEPEERQLVLQLLSFPGAVAAAAASREPHRLTTYMRSLAADFHVFYHNCPVLRAGGETAAFRLSLCTLTRDVIARSLSLVGVKAPERM